MTKQITFDDISNHLDREFHKRCELILGVRKFNELAPAAKFAFELAYKNETNEIKRENSAKRAANMIYTKALLGKG